MYHQAQEPPCDVTLRVTPTRLPCATLSARLVSRAYLHSSLHSAEISNSSLS